MNTIGRARVALAAVAVGVGTWLVAPGAIAQGDIPQTRIVVSDTTQPGSRQAQAWQDYAAAVTEASGGRITFEFFLASSLLPPAEQAEGIGAGTADMGGVLTPYTPALFPVANWMVGFGLIPKGGVPYSLAYGSAGNAEAHLNTPELIEEFADVGIHVIGTWYNQSFDILCTKPVRNLADAKGKRIRTGGQLWSLEAEAIGMIPVPLVPTEIYEGFSRGIVDCLSLHPTGYLDIGLLGVQGQKYYTPVELAGWNTQFMSVNKAKWDSLPASAQKIMIEKLPIFFEGVWAGSIAKHKEFSVAVRNQGIEVLVPEQDLVDAINAFHEKYLADMIKTAPPTVSDPAAVIERARASIEKWKQIADETGLKPSPASFADREAFYDTLPDLKPFMQRFAAELVAVQ